MFDGASNFANNVDGVFLFIMGVSALILLGITIFIIYCLFKYSEKNNTEPEDIHGHLGLELTWTIIPTILVMVMFFYGLEGFSLMRTPPKAKDSIIVKVTGRQWAWSYEYFQYQGEGEKKELKKVKSSQTLVVPVNRPVQVLLDSVDVLHSYYIPAFRLKEDTVPGLETRMWFRATQTGNFDVLCAEYCGKDHAYMRSTVKVLPEEEFKEWFLGSGATNVSDTSGGDNKKSDKKVDKSDKKEDKKSEDKSDDKSTDKKSEDKATDKDKKEEKTGDKKDENKKE